MGARVANIYPRVSVRDYVQYIPRCMSVGLVYPLGVKLCLTVCHWPRVVFFLSLPPHVWEICSKQQRRETCLILKGSLAYFKSLIFGTPRY